MQVKRKDSLLLITHTLWLVVVLQSGERIVTLIEYVLLIFERSSLCKRRELILTQVQFYSQKTRSYHVWINDILSYEKLYDGGQAFTSSDLLSGGEEVDWTFFFNSNKTLAQQRFYSNFFFQGSHSLVGYSEYFGRD